MTHQGDHRRIGVVRGGGNDILTISSALRNDAGVSGFAKGGVGTLVLSGQNTYAGGTTVNDGTLIAQIGNALRSLPADLPNTAFVESTGCSSIDSHMLLFDREPCILLGHRYAKAYQQISAGKNK